MELVSINSLLPNGLKLKKITTGSELLFAYEMDKYARVYLDKGVTLKGISILKQLYKSTEFAFIVSQGLDLGFEFVATKDLADISTQMYHFFTGTVEGVDFVEQSADKWVYNFNKNVSANEILYKANRSTAYLSLMAYMIITSIKNNVSCPKLIIDHSTYPQLELEYCDLLIMQNYGSKLFKNLVEIHFNPNIKTQPEWEAFVSVNRQRGFMQREYTSTEKFKFMKKNFEVGDVVLLYERAKSSKGKTIKKLTSCYPAVIQEIRPDGVKLEYYPSVSTQMTRNMELSEMLDELEEDMEDKKSKINSLISEVDFTRFMKCQTFYSYVDLGTDLLTYTELKFFIRPVDFDGTYQWFKTKDGYDKIWLSTLNTIYAVFEDRGIQYNKERFLEKYFVSRKATPTYEVYRKQGLV